MRCALAGKFPYPAVPATFSPREKERRPRRVCNSTVNRASPCSRAKFMLHGDSLGISLDMRLSESLSSDDRFPRTRTRCAVGVQQQPHGM